MQVDELYTPFGAITDRLLLQLEIDMLLGLAVHQLTASIPDSFSLAQGARELACELKCSALYMLWNKTSLHQLSLPAAYTGPQLALQVMQSPLGSPSLLEQQQQQPQPQPQPLSPPPQDQQPLQQQPQYYTIAPTSQLLTELLPLLTSYCLARVHQQREQQQTRFQMLLVQADGDGLAAGVQDCSTDPFGDILGSLKAVTSPHVVKQCVLGMLSVLSCAVVPDPNLTAAEVQAARAAAAVAAASSSSAGKAALGRGNGRVTYRCILHNADAVMQNAGGVMRVCEALLREAPTICEIAALVHDNRQVAAAVAAAAAAVAAVGGAAAANQLTASLIARAVDDVMWVANAGVALTAHLVCGDYPHTPCALVLAALSAGPGSELQQQLLSLLCSMVKLGSSPVPAAAAPHISNDKFGRAKDNLVLTAASTAAALATGAADDGEILGSAHSRLPWVFILGRFCMWWGQQLHTDAGWDRFSKQLAQYPEQPVTAELILPPVQQWLQATSTQEQLVAAGYAPQALPQQLQQVVAALQTARDAATPPGRGSAGSGQLDSSCYLEAAQLLQTAGIALCSFAVPSMCNNPACANLSGLTDQGLVSGRSCICAGCRVARYCGRACQRAVWKQHKPVCAALAAAADTSSTM